MKNQKEVKNMVCKNCGQEHDKNMIRCPECGYNRFANYLKIFVVSLLAAFMLFASIFTMVKVIQISEKIDAIEVILNNGGAGNSSNAQTYNIETASYYNDLLLTDADDISKLGDDYILYFHQATCSHCQEANVFVDMYVSMEANKYVPIYFVTPDSAPELFANKMFGSEGITSTPTFVRMTNGSVAETVIGTDEGYNMLTPIVEQYSNQ